MTAVPVFVKLTPEEMGHRLLAGTPTGRPNVVGLDLSLTGSGIATQDGVRLVKSIGKATASLSERSVRLNVLAANITARTFTADLVVIEAPAYSSKMGSMHDRSGLWWLVVNLLIWQDRVKVVEVTPSGRAKYATGKGNASKDAVLGEVIRRFPGYTDNNNNTADAYVLMAMGLDHLGHALVELPQTHRAALDAVRWPE